mmetsp:Transcript_21616/g.67729  ORF Transcript_21616/g.67729 Transcript_21616/m.67729 type:complete len:208 (+) Transcript_21616:278-901(+)
MSISMRSFSRAVRSAFVIPFGASKKTLSKGFLRVPPPLAGWSRGLSSLTSRSLSARVGRPGVGRAASAGAVGARDGLASCGLEVGTARDLVGPVLAPMGAPSLSAAVPWGAPALARGPAVSTLARLERRGLRACTAFGLRCAGPTMPPGSLISTMSTARGDPHSPGYSSTTLNSIQSSTCKSGGGLLFQVTLTSKPSKRAAVSSQPM